MFKGGLDCSMWDAPEGISQVEPGNIYCTLVQAGITYDGFEQVGMFVAAFCRAGALLFVREDVVSDGPGGDMFANHPHEQFIDAGHQGEWAEVGGVVQGTLLVD